MAAAGTAEFWKHWEGREAAEGLTLGPCLGGGAHSAVFLSTAPSGEKCAIRLVRANPSTAELQLSRWQRAARLSHPNLLRLLGSGRCQLDDTAMLYVVMEFADEDLSQIIPERGLSASEAREMLPPVLAALRYLHRQGFVHGRLKPANIMAVGDQVKISGDGLWRVGEMGERRAAPGRYDPPEMVTSGPSAAGDVWSLGIALTEILTQHVPSWGGPGQNELSLPEGMPEPFAEMVRHCLKADARSRWTVDQIAAFLETGRAPVTVASAPLVSGEPREASSKRLMVLGAAAVVLIAVLLLWNRSTPSDTTGTAKTPAAQTQPAATPTPPSTPAPAPVVAEPKSAPVEKAAPPEEKPKRSERTEEATIEPQVTPSSGDIALQVMPKVTQRSLDAIHGKFSVAIRAKVNAQGDVTSAEYSVHGPSKFFAEKTMAAAKQWHFKPTGAAQEWILHFDYSKGAVNVSPTKSGN